MKNKLPWTKVGIWTRINKGNALSPLFWCTQKNHELPLLSSWLHNFAFHCVSSLCCCACQRERYQVVPSEKKRQDSLLCVRHALVLIARPRRTQSNTFTNYVSICMFIAYIKRRSLSLIFYTYGVSSYRKLPLESRCVCVCGILVK